MNAQEVLNAFLPTTKQVLAQNTMCEVEIYDTKIKAKQTGELLGIFFCRIPDQPRIQEFPNFVNIPTPDSRYRERDQRLLNVISQVTKVKPIRIQNNTEETLELLEEWAESIKNSVVLCRLGVRKSQYGAYYELNRRDSFVY